ncbi:ABC transporter permease subunit [Acrocarpospora macrocephala]|uniref:ABC transporter n=1 Tax=Acrocarpospora macrocephala TaxID=150177 RepID=A0A5M3WEE1_9ACTN|nr:ABC transporter permease subunit [Acrocarpospora macrocephala]GES06452.1 ABC transporter [Acrocarpospora macrocephala]
MTVTAILRSEWTKIRTVPSTVWTLLLTFALSVGLGYLLANSMGDSYATASPERRATLDPLFATFYSLTLGQLPLVVFGVLVVGGEYGSGTIRASLLAVPRRGRFYGGKLLAGTALAFPVSVITVLATFFVATSAFGPDAPSLRDEGVPSAVVGACLYLTLICLFAMGVATMLRSPTRSLGILLPLLFLGSQGLGNVPGVKAFTQYLPDQAGMLIMHIVGPQDDPRWARDYGPWTGMGILALWTIAALLGGHLVLRRRDA